MRISSGTEQALEYVNMTESSPQLSTESKGSEDNSASILKTSLSASPVIPPCSNLASSTQRATSPTGSNNEDLRVIGLGSCGTVFEIRGTEEAFKKGTNEHSIWTDFCLTNRVHNAFHDIQGPMQEIFPNLTIPKTPRCYDFYLTDDEDFWSAHLQRFPAGFQTKQTCFTVDRILPLSKKAREALIDLYFDEDDEMQREAKADEKNGDCLVRTYLGEMESVRQQSDTYDSLRNFPLRLNMMEDLDLDISTFASEMAIGLAVMHWQAQVDGMDAEFVLGSCATEHRDRTSAYDNECTLPRPVRRVAVQCRPVHLWLLDFDKSHTFDFTTDDVTKKLVPASLGNDPYYPRPRVDEDLWAVFSGTYIEASALILEIKGVGQRIEGLPQFFLDEVVRVSGENEDWSEEGNIIFGEGS